VAGTDDGQHKLDGKLKRRLSSVLVTPLQPPFKQNFWTISFGDDTDLLALSAEDHAKVKALMAGQMQGQHIVLGPASSTQIRISLEGGWDDHDR
jgi:hypothetical protein